MDIKDVNDMESRIIEAAKRVFVRKGYEAATMSDVATEAGIGRTALHYYYRTKEILFDAIFGQLISSLLPNINRILDEEGTMLEKLPLLIDQYMGVVRKNPMIPIFVISELNRDPQHLLLTLMKDPGRVQTLLKLRTCVEGEMEQGMLRKMPLLDLISAVISLVAFPMLIRQPLCSIFLEGDMSQFEEFMDRRQELIVEVTTQMLKI